MNKQRILSFWSSLLLLLNMTSVSLVIAGPIGGQVVGGSGSISQSGLNTTTTTINQTSQNMAIDWQSYNLNANERVQYIQPNSSSISLNRILSQNGSTIAGRIDANGQVILVNSNGIFFTPTSIINVGGIIASGLNIQPGDFMNGHYIFDEVLGTDGTVVNSGIINASLGGNVALMGKQVKNDGLITANLGTVSLAAGKQAVLTFDNDGLLGVRVSKEILQEELGVDPAVLNNGEINARGGRVLLTASTSQDVFSQAVNTGSLSQATSVVVHEDGSFTLGGGADVVNSGGIDTSTIGDTQNIGRIVLIGENVTSSGGLYADATSGNGGEIELHAQSTALLTENSLTSARSEADGQGGIVKVLGDRVGLFEQSRVDVSGANGGGQVLIGGDYLGGNANIRNATTTVVSREAVLSGDALQQGDGGRIILWSDQNAYFWGDITVRGGALSGNGGFVETSGKENLLFDGNVNLSANNGENGLLLLDPRDIMIVLGNDDEGTQNNSELTAFDDLSVFFDDGDNASFNITAERIESVLASGNVQFEARRDIDINASINSNSNNSNLTLLAGDDITVSSDVNIGSGDLLMIAGSASCQLNCDMSDGGGGGGVDTGRNIYVNGQLNTTGSVDLYAADHVIIDEGIGDSLTPGSVTIRAGDSILVNAIDNDNSIEPSGSSIEPSGSSNEGRITSSGAVSLTASDTALQTDEITINTTSGPVTTAITVAPTNTAVGTIVVEGNVTTGDGDFTVITTAGYFNNLFNDQNLNVGMGTVSIQTGGTGTSNVDATSVTAGAFLGNITTNTLSVSTMGEIIQSTTVASQNLVITGEASFNAGSNPINLLNNNNDLQGTISLITTGSNGVILNNVATTTILGTTTGGALNIGGTLTVNAEQNLTLANNITVGGTAQLNFAQDGNNDRIFTTSAGLAFATNTTVAGGDGNDIFNITSNMAGQINGNGGNDIFNFQSDLDNATFSGTVNGGAGDDTFTINGTSVTFDNTLNGGTGNGDTLEAASEANYWLIDGAESGGIYANTGDRLTPSNERLRFSNIENLVGNNGIDDFLMGASGSITRIDGGIGTNTNTNTLTGRNVNNTWNITGTGNNLATTSGNNTYVTRFTNIDTLTGGSATDGTVIDTFNISADFTGTINGGIDGVGAGVDDTSADIFNFTSDLTGFSGTVNGGQGDDAFNIQTTGISFDGDLNGNQGADTFDIQGTENTFSVAIDGGAGNDNLNAADEGNYWLIDGAESGGIYANTGDRSTPSNERLRFSNIENLVGNNGIDDFLMGASGSITDIDGGDGISTNTLTGRNVANEWEVSATNSGALYTDNNADGFGTSYVTAFTNIQNLTGGNNSDTFTIVGTSRVGMINGGGIGSGGADEIRGPVSTGPVIWILGSTNSTVDNGSPINFTNIQTLTGANDTSDAFNFTVMPASTGVMTIDGGSNSDTTTTDTVSIASVTSGVLLNVGAYQEIETYIGNAGSTLEGGTSNIWTIEDIGGTTPGINDGTINASTNFYDFGTVRGGSGTDTFTFVGAATMVSIDGADGANSITGPDGTTTLTLATAMDTTLSIDDGTTSASTILANIQTLNGGTGEDTFVVNTTAAASGVTTINGGAGNDVFVFSGALPVAAGMTVSGQADTDTLDLSGNAGTIGVALNQYNVERIIGNNNNSTFTGLAGTNTWSITPVAVTAGSSTFTDGQNDGTSINGSASQTFIGFNNLTGGNGSDIFTIEASGNLDGLLSGGGGTGNTVTILNTSVANVEMGTTGASSNLNVTGISSITGNGVTTLISDSSIVGDWTITGANAGILNDMTFSDFALLQGGTNNDTFNLQANIDFSGSIEGGITGTDEIIAGNRATNNWVITASNNTGTVTGITGNFSGIETLTGGNQTDNFTLLNAVNFNGSMNGGDGTDQLTGGNGGNIWTINGNNAGSVTGLDNGFTSMETLVGGSQQDTFNLSDDMTFNGTLSGGAQNNDQNDRLVAGNRENDWAVTGANNTGTVTGLAGAFTAIEFLNGNNRRDTLTLSNTDTFSGSFDGAGGINDAVIGGNTTNNWTITAADNSGTVTGLSGTFTRVEALTGTSAQDTFTLLAGIDFNGNIDGGTGSAIDTLVGGATDNGWVIDGTNGNTVTGLGAGNTFNNIQNLSGATGAFDDTFTFRNAGSIDGSIDGGGQAIQDIVDMSALSSAITVRLGVGQDVTNVERVIGNNNGTSNEPDPFSSTLVAENNRNIWAIDGINRGTVDDVEFIDFNNLQGGTTADTFVISGGGDITGLIDGGSPTRALWSPGTATPAPVVEGILQTEDILDYSALASVDIIIDTDFSNIELVKGNVNGTGIDDSTLGTGATGNSNWLILSAGTGVVNSTQFVDFNNIVGGNGDDTFVIEGDFGGSIRGGGGGGTDTVNYQALDTFRVVFGGELGITGIERVEGDGSGFTLVGRAGFDNAWTINGNNQGAVTTGSETLAFVGFDNIEGNNESAYTDTFTVQDGSIDGSVLGMAGDDALIVELTGSETGQLFFNGGAGTNMVLLQDGATTAAYRGEYTTGITGGYDQLQYTNIIAGTPRIFTLNYQQAGQIQDTVSANLFMVNGTPDADMIELGFDSFTGMNTFSVNGATPIVHYSNKDDLTILGLGDLNDTVNITTDPGLVNGTGVLTINAETVTSTSTITANQLVLDSVITAGTASTPMNINVINLSLADSADVASQALYLQAQNGLTLTQLGAVERVDINVLDGNFTNSVALITNSQLGISTSGTTGGNIVLTGNNQFSGDVTLNASNDIIFDGDNTFSGTTRFTALNDISLTGVNTISASISLDATTINLSGDNQITAIIALQGTTATINNTVATDLGDVTVQSLTVISTDSITDSGVIDVQAAGMGQANLTTTNGNIVLDNANNNFDVINLVATNGAVTVNEADGISIATASMSGVLNVTSNIGLAANEVSINNNMAPGNITAATIDLNANEGAIVSQSSDLRAETITLTAASGIGSGTVAINTTTSTLSVINASLDDTDMTSEMPGVNTAETSGVININNTGDVTINDLRNYGNISLTNSGNIILNVTDTRGAIDANYGGNISDVSYGGSVTVSGAESNERNNVSTMGVGTLSGIADIIAENLLVEDVSRFGTQASPIGLRVNNNFILLADPGQGQGAVYYLGSRPRNIITPEALLQLAIQGFIGISSQQLIDIETLGDIDQAIFTEVRNYNYDDIAIRLPADQNYGDDDNTDEENAKEAEN